MDEEIPFGEVAKGWSMDHWIEELGRMASRCERVRPDRAKFFHAWAQKARGKFNG